jgi:Cation transport protein
MAEQLGFSAFNILFEDASAYGTVGLSLGVPDDSYSLSGAFQTGSKLVTMAVMIRGRHRGLPLTIDRSILLPGQGLMHKMDREYNEYGELDSNDEAAALRDEELSGKKDLPGGKGAEQDPERNENDNPEEGGVGHGMSEGQTQDSKGKSKAQIELS